MNDIESKLADHAFEMIKFIISLVTFVAGLYVTLLAAYFAFVASDFVQSGSNSYLSSFMIFISAITAIFLWFAYWIVKKLAVRYGRYLNGASGSRQHADVQRGLEALMPVGFYLAGAATACLIGAVVIILLI